MFEIDLYNLLQCALALIILINPVSKVFILSTIFSKKIVKKDFVHICLKSTYIALAILLLFTWAGNFLLRNVFQVDIYSLQILGGLVLSQRGLSALNKGVFFETKSKKKLEDMSIVPLASPMIAGPATISAAISFPHRYGLPVTSIAIIVTVFINLLIMINTKSISNFLLKYNMMGAMIRITGMIVATIGVQMMLNGIHQFIAVI